MLKAKEEPKQVVYSETILPKVPQDHKRSQHIPKVATDRLPL
jgi:hypothetical protein